MLKIKKYIIHKEQQILIWKIFKLMDSQIDSQIARD